MKSLINRIFTICEIILLLALALGIARFFHVTKTYAIKPGIAEFNHKNPKELFKTFTSDQLREAVVSFVDDDPVEVSKTTATIPKYKLPKSDEIKAIYMTSWVASDIKRREKLIGVVEESPVLNAIVIDLKDETGVISIPVPKNSELYPYVNENKNVRIPDIKDMIDELHEKGIYVIGRIAVFQDNIYTQKIPESAIKNSKTGEVWKDRKKVAWIDPGYKPTWKYVLNIAQLAQSLGFDEINFDYVRYPTESSSEYKLVFASSGDRTREAVIKEFFEYLSKGLKEKEITSSVDIFGLLTTENDIGIGQNLEIALDNFDYVAPMIYPSHYTSGSLGIDNPDAHPYETIFKVMQDAYSKAELGKHDFKQIRPWVQDFTLKEKYGVKQVVDQLRALSVHGTKGFMVWSPNNVYTESAYTAFGDELIEAQ